VVASVAEEHESTRDGAETAPIDVQVISSITDKALALRLTTSTRDEIMSLVGSLRGALDLLVREDVGAERDMVALTQVRKAYTFLDVKKVPTEETPVFSAYAWAREAASLTRRLLWIWTEENDAEHP
jgi:hypothetical protein